jgi:hypothetical protein
MRQMDERSENILLRSIGTFNNSFWGYGGDYWEMGEVQVTDSAFYFVPQRSDLQRLRVPLNEILGASRVVRDGIIAITDFVLLTKRGDFVNNVQDRDVDRIVGFVNSLIRDKFGIDDSARAEFGIRRLEYRMGLGKIIQAWIKASNQHVRMGPTRATLLVRS